MDKLTTILKKTYHDQSITKIGETDRQSFLSYRSAAAKCRDYKLLDYRNNY